MLSSAQACFCIESQAFLPKCKIVTQWQASSLCIIAIIDHPQIHSRLSIRASPGFMACSPFCSHLPCSVCAPLLSGFTDQGSSFGEKSLLILPQYIRRQEVPLLGKQLLSFLIYSSDCIFPLQGGKRKEGDKGTPETAARCQETNW